jgi:hypothetical protein
MSLNSCCPAISLAGLNSSDFTRHPFTIRSVPARAPPPSCFNPATSPFLAMWIWSAV